MTWDHSAISEKFSGSLRGSREAPRFGGPTTVQRGPIGDVSPAPDEISTDTREGRREVARRRELAHPLTGHADPPRNFRAAEKLLSQRTISMIQLHTDFRRERILHARFAKAASEGT